MAQLGNASAYTGVFQQIAPSDSTTQDSTVVEKYEPSFRPTFEQQDRFGDPFTNTQSPSPLLLEDPSNLTLDVEIDSAGNYTIYERIGALNYRPRTTMTRDQFYSFQEDRMKKAYWQDRSAGLDGESAVSGRRLIPKIYISPVFDRIFGGNYVDIQPTGNVVLDFGGQWQNVQTPGEINTQRNGGFNYNQQISMNVVGNIGEKMAITANFDNNNTFDYQNNLKIEYTGYEEDIIKKIEIGNVSLPVSNSLMGGGQALFGVKTQMQFGKLYVTALASRQQSTRRVQSYSNRGIGGEDGGNEKSIVDYEEATHFFLGHFFRDHYEEWLQRLPNVTSQVQITDVQVYVIRRQSNNETVSRRAIIGISDLGETDKLGSNALVLPGQPRPIDNSASRVYDIISGLPGIRDKTPNSSSLTSAGLIQNEDFAIYSNARRLEENEFTVHPSLGYISLRSRLQNEEALAVAFQYSYQGVSYRVGEFPSSNQNQSTSQPLILKLLKAEQPNLDKPIWDLMMKNIYLIGDARNVAPNDFSLSIFYEDNVSNNNLQTLNEGVNTTNVFLLELLGLDQLNVNGDKQPDNNFDFIEGVTFDSEYGRLKFPVLEPFGATLESKFTESEENLKERYVFNELYEETLASAKQIAAKNKFTLNYKVAGKARTQYVLEQGFNAQEQSVQVFANGALLQEGRDYRINMNGIPTVVLSDAIAASNPDIEIGFEDADVFSFSSKWLTGARFDYQFSEKINVGATVLRLNERTQGRLRYSIGEEPVSNTKYGFDVNFEEESRVITKAIDALPLLSTKEPSKVTFSGEFAQLLSNTSNKVNGESTSFLDDFESAAITYPLGGELAWKLGSTPVDPNGNSFDFDQRLSGGVYDSLGLGYRRAKLAWYNLKRSMYTVGAGRPPGDDDQLKIRNPYVRALAQQEILNIDIPPQTAQLNKETFDLAYFPDERGQYNYNNRPEDYNNDGTFVRPELNFGAISRTLPTNGDFNVNNVEYIEFWLMDPFISEARQDIGLESEFDQGIPYGGELVFNLGRFSEDIHGDGIHAYENGLDATGGTDQTIDNAWGRMSQKTYLTDIFSSEASAIQNQDVGLDGLNQNLESQFFGEHMSAISRENPSGSVDQAIFANQFAQDFSADNYRSYLDPSYDASTANILERYKDVNGLEGNSISFSSDRNTAQTLSPDKEDLDDSDSPNLNSIEQYFEYKISIDERSLADPDNRYIVDQAEDNAGANWYLFRIPVQRPTDTKGNPQFNSVPHMRMYMTNWRHSVVLRMMDFRLVASQWRRFTGDLSSERLGVVPPPTIGDFEVSMVSVEQNSEPVGNKPPYVLPPGLSRDLDNTSYFAIRQNEQSLKLSVENLKDGDARGAFKTPVNVDLVNYRRLKMFFHAERIGEETEIDLADDDVNAFLRLARDETDNYYEIEFPLKITDDNLSTTNADDLARLVWPEANEIDLALSELYDLKTERNRNNAEVTARYSIQSGKYKLTVIGNPKLSDIQYLMIGVRNPIVQGVTGEEKSVAIWANELRVTDFDTENGWAANARMNLQLADFATIKSSARYVSSGYGDIQDRISDRTREEREQYDIGADVNIDKLIPWKTGIKIPMSVSMSSKIETPKYDPRDRDTPLATSLDQFDNNEEREEYRNKIVTQETSRSINFINVHKEKVKQDAKSHIYDIENFAFSYSYSEREASNVYIEQELRKNYLGSVSYTFSPQAPSIEPFKKTKSLSSPYLKLIKDINFTPLPNNFSARASINRDFLKTQNYNDQLTTDGIDPVYLKQFYFDRDYSLRWNLFKNLSLNLNSSTHAIIDERSQLVDGRQITVEGSIDTKEEQDYILDQIRKGGRIKTYDHTLSANYRLPLDKLPLTDWMSADYSYSAGYSWFGNQDVTAAEGEADELAFFGHKITNNRSQDLTTKFDLVKLYNKSKMLSEINKPPRPSRRQTVDTTQQSTPVFKGLLRLLMSVRSVNMTYSKREGTSLPGFDREPSIFGFDDRWEAPGTAFLLGSQSSSILDLATQKDDPWLVRNNLISDQFTQSITEDINIRGTIEPFKDFRIQVDMKRSATDQYTEFLNYDAENDEFLHLTPNRNGSYSITFLPIATAFQKTNKQNVSEAFEQFEENISLVEQRVTEYYSDPTGERAGINNQDVLIPSFIAAYTGQSAATVDVAKPFPVIPMPNWRVDYAGLSKVKAFQDLFSSVNITHSYSSTFQINSFKNSNIYADRGNNGNEILDLSNSFVEYPKATLRLSDTTGLVPVYDIQQVSIVERFSPLVGINVRTKSNISIRMEYNRQRSLTLDIPSRGVKEETGNDFTFDIGVSKNQMKLPFRVRGRTVVIKNDVQMRMAFTMRENKVIQHEIQGFDEAASGNLSYDIKPTITYQANNRLRMTMYYSKSINEPLVSTTARRTNSAFGVQFSFSLSQ